MSLFTTFTSVTEISFLTSFSASALPLADGLFGITAEVAVASSGAALS